MKTSSSSLDPTRKAEELPTIVNERIRPRCTTAVPTWLASTCPRPRQSGAGDGCGMLLLYVISTLSIAYRDLCVSEPKSLVAKPSESVSNQPKYRFGALVQRKSPLTRETSKMSSIPASLGVVVIDAQKTATWSRNVQSFGPMPQGRDQKRSSYEQKHIALKAERTYPRQS